MKYLLSICCLLSIYSISQAQVSTDSALYIDLKKLDSLIFDQGFNQCKIEDFEPLIYEDFEFYHDKGGLTEGKEIFIQSIRNNICSNPDGKMTRKLVPGSLEVYPMYDKGLIYAAIQSGVHEFYMTQPGKEAFLTGNAKFTHLWIKTVNGWKLKRVLSYDH